MVGKFPPYRSERKKRSTSEGTPQFPNGISGKLPYHLSSNRNFRIFWPNVKHPRFPGGNFLMENLYSIYRFIVLSPVPCLSRSIKRPGLPRMGLVTNGTRFSQTEIPNRKFPNFFVNGKRPRSPGEKNKLKKNHIIWTGFEPRTTRR